MASTKQVAILGGGQLGRMLALAAVPLGVAVHVLDPAGPECPAAIAATSAIKGDFKKKNEVLAFVEKVRPDVLTVEIEHVDVDALEAVQSKYKIAVQPEPATIRVIQDKLLQKQHLSAHGLAVPRYKAVSGVDDIKAVFDDYGSQLVLKSRTLAYDGRGNAVVKDIQNVHAALKSLVSAEVYVEEFVEFEMELAVMVARSTKGEIVSHPCVQTIQKDSICHTVIAPAQVDGPIAAKARELAEAAVATLKGAGIFGVELFMLRNGSLLINEIAPRVHNSGHYTIEACHTSQFEQHLRAILGLPLGDASMRVPAAVMLNILGNGTLGQTLEPCMRSLRVPGASMHWYNKGEARAGRKMGHITVTAATMEQVFERLHQITLVDNRVSPSLPQVGIIMGSDSDLPAMSAAAKILTDFKVPFEIHVVSAHRTPRRMFEYATTAHERSLKVIIAGAGGAAHLPGMVASLTPLPVIGVPVPLKHLDGVDSLYSIVQMPRGVPVAAVAIDNAANAGLLAVRMLGAFEPQLLQQMVEYQKRLGDDVLNKDQKLQEVGWQAYK